MLVLSRRNSESVVVGDPAGRDDQLLKVTVVEIGRGRVRLGFEVADDIPINRWEVWHQIRSGLRRNSRRKNPTPPVVQ
jgi:carbon storage regulator CsrA